MVFENRGAALVLVLGFASALIEHQVRQKLDSARLQSYENSSGAKNPSKKSEPKPAYYDFVEGRYTNFNYAYSVLVPKGMMGVTVPAPMPQHGFGINLLNPASLQWTEEKGQPESVIWVDGSYNAALWKSDDELINVHLEWKRNESKKVRLLGRTQTHLGPLQATRFVIAYQDVGAEMIEYQIVAFRKEDDIVYSIRLVTPLSRYLQDRRWMAEIQRTWLVDPLPDDYPTPPPDEEINR